MIMMLKMPIACLMLLSYSFYFYKKNKRLRTYAAKMFEAMMLSVLINLVADTVTEFTVNHRETVPEQFNYVWHIIFLITIMHLCFFMYFYLITYVERGSGKRKRFEKKMTVAAWIAGAAAILFLPIEYIDTPYGSYSLGPKAYALYCVVIYVIIVMFYNLFRYQKQIPRVKREVLLFSIGIFVAFSLAQIIYPYILVTGLGMSLIVMGIMMSTEDAHMYLDIRTGFYNELGGKELINDNLIRDKEFMIAVYVYVGDTGQTLSVMKKASEFMGETYQAETVLLSDNVLLFIQSVLEKKKTCFPECLPQFAEEHSGLSENCLLLKCDPSQSAEEIRRVVFAFKEKIEEAELYRDELTGLLRRGAFIRKVNECLQMKKSFAVVMTDIDDFKYINDSYGHTAGDEILCKTADVFRQTTREGDIICRMGGDEFAVLLPDVSEKEQVEEIILRIGRQIECLHIKENENVSVSVSFGAKICCDSFEKLTFQTIYQEADAALYQAKQQGKHCGVILKDERK